MSLTVIGSGAFGTALAISLSKSHDRITLWGRDADMMANMQVNRRNSKRLPDVTLPDNIICVSGRLPTDDEIMLLAVPMQTLSGVLESAPNLDGKTLVACCKGIDMATGQGPSAILKQAAPNATPAILTGPSFAADIAKGLPTALTLACENSGNGLQNALQTPNLRIYRTPDLIGAELGGALKNVIAIACGAAIGAGLGASARASLMTRGFAEMGRMATALGARSETLAGLSGFGDLALTCTSDQSRNYRLGLALGQGQSFDASVTVEGAATARATLQRATDLKIDMPITQAVVALLDGTKNIPEVMAALLARPQKEE